MDSGDTLVGALTDAGVSSDDANAAVVALRKVYNPRALRAGQSFHLSFAPGEAAPVARITYTPPNQADDSNGSGQPPADAPSKLLSISFSPTIDHDITVSRAADGAFRAQDVEKQLVARYHRAGGTIDSSLYLAAMQAGIPAEAVVQMIHIFSYQVDFQRDIHPGRQVPGPVQLLLHEGRQAGEAGRDRLRLDDRWAARPTRSTATRRRTPTAPTISTARAAAPRAC